MIPPFAVKTNNSKIPKPNPPRNVADLLKNAHSQTSIAEKLWASRNNICAPQFCNPLFSFVDFA